MIAVPTGSQGLCESCNKRRFVYLVELDGAIGRFTVCESCLPVPVRRW